MDNLNHCCRLCLKKNNSSLINCLDISELCDTVREIFGFQIRENDVCSTRICKECITKVTNIAMCRKFVLFNQESIARYYELQSKILEVPPEVKRTDDDDSVIYVSKAPSIQVEKIEVSSSQIPTSSFPAKVFARKSTTKLPFDVQRKRNTKLLKVICSVLEEKDVKDFYLNKSDQKLLKLNGKKKTVQAKVSRNEKQKSIFYKKIQGELVTCKISATIGCNVIISNPPPPPKSASSAVSKRRTTVAARPSPIKTRGESYLLKKSTPNTNLTITNSRSISYQKQDPISTQTNPATVINDPKDKVQSVSELNMLVDTRTKNNINKTNLSISKPCKLPIQITLVRVRNKIVIKLFDSANRVVHYSQLSESDKCIVRNSLLHEKNREKFVAAMRLYQPDTYLLELLNSLGLVRANFQPS